MTDVSRSWPAVFCPPPLALPLREKLLRLALFVTVASSSVAFIEPSPHDVLMGLFAVVCVAAGVRLDRTLVVLIGLLLVWNLAGIAAMLPVHHQPKTIQYVGISVYLAIAAILFASLLVDQTMARLTTLRRAYVATAVCAALLGVIGYFRLLPGADIFAPGGRALGMFKDPNVYGPFLIWPILFTLERLLNDRIRLLDLAIIGVLLSGLFLSFSRGAWFHCALSAAVVIGLSLLTAPTHIARLRVVSLTLVSIGILAGLVVVALSFDAVASMFNQRAQLIQSYDVGSGGRFLLQEIAVGSVLDFPNGMGPLEFARVQGMQQHNMYLQSFLVYGWLGGIAYLLLVTSTCFVGLRAAFQRTPWRPYVMTAIGAFIGEIAEGFVIDTDHWRHFFLLLGMVWGLAAATGRQQRSAAIAGEAKIPFTTVLKREDGVVC